MTARGNERRDVFFEDSDRVAFLEVLKQVCERFNWLCHAYCLMGNHYHLLIETLDGNLSQGMRQLNGVYTQYINRTHKRVGHLFQGRFKSILVQKDSYLLELARYIVLNPVRAGMVGEATEWPWSSYRATLGLESAPSFLTTDWLLSGFGADRQIAVEGYGRFVEQGVGSESPWRDLRGRDLSGLGAVCRGDAGENPFGSAAEGCSPPAKTASGASIGRVCGSLSGTGSGDVGGLSRWGLQYAAIGDHFGVGRSTVSRAVKRYEL